MTKSVYLRVFRQMLAELVKQIGKCWASKPKIDQAAGDFVFFWLFWTFRRMLADILHI